MKAAIGSLSLARALHVAHTAYEDKAHLPPDSYVTGQADFLGELFGLDYQEAIDIMVRAIRGDTPVGLAMKALGVAERKHAAFEREETILEDLKARGYAIIPPVNEQD